MTSSFLNTSVLPAPVYMNRGCPGARVHRKAYLQFSLKTISLFALYASGTCGWFPVAGSGLPGVVPELSFGGSLSVELVNQEGHTGHEPYQNDYQCFHCL